jgi:galactonate dehydratase
MHNTKGPIGIVAAAHLMASIPNAAPMELVMGIDWRDDLLTEPLRIEAGALIVPDGPGWGIELDLESIAAHQWRA